MGKGDSSISGAVFVRLLAVFMVIAAVVIGIGLGLSLAETSNIKNQENFVSFTPALPTKILDINGNLVTEFSADEKRELVSLSELPRHLIYAILAREDPDFFHHKGFSIKGIARAAFGRISGQNLGGGSTITQQIAGLLYTDRTDYSISRKIRELWWSLQMERRYTKNEILEIYLNYINMGPGTYGVEAASKYFFGHSAREVSIAEAAILAVLPSSPSRYNPLSNPNDAMDRQHRVLDRMIDFGYAAREETEESFTEYWDNYDYTRTATAAYFHREDAAPWFSEYVRRELETMMYGTMDYFRDGFTVHTTLNMKHQDAAVKLMEEGLAKANVEYLRSSRSSNVQAERTYIPIVELLALTFDLRGIHSTARSQGEQRAMSQYTKVINPVVDLAALAFGIESLKPITNKGFADLKVNSERNVVEGALISIENETGYITAIVGGSKYDESNQLIRATQGNVQPGSSFKPLYYSAAIDSRKLSPSSLITDVPIVFHNEDGTPYLPLNFRGEWKGTVLLYDALAQSMNVPSLQVLDTVGFDAAIDRAAALMGYTDPDQIRSIFPRVYPLGLGIISTSPLRMARAFAVFGNQGREVSPIAIRYVENRNGSVVLDVERDLRLAQRRKGNGIQVVSPQNAWVMTSMLKRTLENGPFGWGTLYNPSGWGSKFTFSDENGKTFRMPIAGKTGTPQNWSDAWTVGYSAYYTTAVWFGFDKPGNSLGINLTGSTLAGPVWADYMREIHRGLAYRNFVRPNSGIIDVTVCAKSGHLRTSDCNEGEITLSFLAGTQPMVYCTTHGNTGNQETLVPRYRETAATMNSSELVRDLSMPTLPPEFMLDTPRQNTTNRNTTAPNRNTAAPNRNTATPNRNTAQANQTPFSESESDDIEDLYDVPGYSGGAAVPDYGGLEMPSWDPLMD